MTGRTIFAVTTAAALASGLIACSGIEGSGLDFGDFCEVHLKNMTTPVVNLKLITTQPHEKCDLYLINGEGSRGTWEYIKASKERWNCHCPPTEGSGDCEIEIDPILASSARDAMLRCEPDDGLECQGRHPGEREQCELADEEIPLMPSGDGYQDLRARNIISVDTFDDDPNILAVTWVGQQGAGEPSAETPAVVFVTFLTWDREGWGTEADHIIDVCQQCDADTFEGAPNHEFVAIQTATRLVGTEPRVILPGVCGSRGVVEVGRDGGCEHHPVNSPVDAPPPQRRWDQQQPEAVLAVRELPSIAGEDPSYLVVWTNGPELYTTILNKDLGIAAGTTPQRHAQSYVTDSREFPAAFCQNPLPGEADTQSSCTVLWSEVNEFDSVNPTETADEALQWTRLVEDGEPATSGYSFASGENGVLRNLLGAGRRSRMLAVQPDISGANPLQQGVLVFQHSEHGMMARRWHTKQPVDLNCQDTICFSEDIIQLDNTQTDAPFGLAPLGVGKSIAAWHYQKTRQASEPWYLGVAVLGVQNEGDQVSVIEATLTIPALESSPILQPHQPLLASGDLPLPGDPTKTTTWLLAGSNNSDGEATTCQYNLAFGPVDAEGLASPTPGAPVEVWGEAGPPYTLGPIGADLAFDGAPAVTCAECRPAAIWVQGRFVVAFPGTKNIQVVVSGPSKVRPGEIDTATNSVTLGENVRACNIDLWTHSGVGSDGSVYLVYDVNGENGQHIEVKKLQFSPAFQQADIMLQGRALVTGTATSPPRPPSPSGEGGVEISKHIDIPRDLRVRFPLSKRRGG